MLPLWRPSLLVALLSVLPLEGAEQALLFYHGEQQLEQIQGIMQPLPAATEGWDWQYLELKSQVHEVQEAQTHAQALRYGVMMTPCLVLVQEDGSYQTIAGQDLDPSSLEQQLKQSAQKAQQPDERMGHWATLYAHNAIIASPVCSEAELSLAIVHCREALSSASMSVADKQLIGLRLLYPLLLRQYTRARKAKGAHTPANESKLLEAVTALEAARDLDPESSLGRAASEQREELRRARLKSRAYE